jgi:hypothetical protein
MREARLVICCLIFAGLLQRCHADDLYGVDFESGDLYRISTANAALAFVGNTGLARFGSLEFAPDGRLLGFTTSVTTPTLYQINPATAATVEIGSLNIGSVFEGGLAFGSDGTAYGVNQGDATAAKLFKIDLSNGQASVIGVISGGNRDINGIGWRSDGTLVGLDRVSNALLIIDPTTANTNTLVALDPQVGVVGGMAVIADQGYFSTAGPGSGLNGSNSLYSFNAMTGAYALVGSFSPTITGFGISGLALQIPEPSSAVLAILGLTLCAARPLISWRRARLSHTGATKNPAVKRLDLTPGFSR